MDDFASDSLIGVGTNYINFESSNLKSAKPISVLKKNSNGSSSNSVTISKTPVTTKSKKNAIARADTPLKTNSNVAGQSVEKFEKIKFTLDAENVVCFYGRGHFLSTFYEAPLEVCGHRYYSVEHYYEATKLFALVGPQAAVQLQNVKDPIAAKAMSRRMISQAKVDKKRVEKWRKNEGIEVVKRALSVKYARGTELAQKLIDTSTALLVQANPRDDLWAVNMDEKAFGDWIKQHDKHAIYLPAIIDANTVNHLPSLGRNGKNLLGFLLMQQRDSLRDSGKGKVAKQLVLGTIREEVGESLGQVGETSLITKNEGLAAPIDDGIIAANERAVNEIGRKLAEINIFH